MTEELLLLFVCNANECRSALAEWHFRAALPENSGIAVASAGITARPGHPMLAECAMILGDAGTATFRSSAVTAELLDRTDAVVTMTMAELTEVLRIRPRSLSCAVTLPELARAATRRPTPRHADITDRLADLVRWTVRHRGALAPADRRDNDIPDPVGQSADVLQATAATVAGQLDLVVGGLGMPAELTVSPS